VAEPLELAGSCEVEDAEAHVRVDGIHARVEAVLRHDPEAEGLVVLRVLRAELEGGVAAFAVLEQLLHDATEVALAALGLERADAMDPAHRRVYIIDHERHLEEPHVRDDAAVLLDDEGGRAVGPAPADAGGLLATLLDPHEPGVEQLEDALLEGRVVGVASPTAGGGHRSGSPRHGWREVERRGWPAV